MDRRGSRATVVLEGECKKSRVTGKSELTSVKEYLGQWRGTGGEG